MNTIVNNYRGKEIKFLDWYGQHVCTYYGPIVNYLLSINLFEESAIFATPQIMENASDDEIYILWSSDKFTNEAKCILNLNESEKTVALKLLDDIIKELDECANQLLADEKFDKVKFGQLIKKAIQFPDHSFVFYENGKILLTGWGFVFHNEDNKKVLSLSTDIEKRPGATLSGTLNDDENKLSNNPELTRDSVPNEGELNNYTTIEETDSKNDDISPTGSNVANVKPEDQRDNFDETNKDKDEVIGKGSNVDFSFWLKRLLILALLLLLGYILYYMLTDSDPIPIAPDKVIESETFEIPFEKIKEFDPGKIQPGPGQDSIFNIVGDRLNIAIIDQNKNIEIVEKLLNSKFDTTKFNIVYKNSITNRIQIEGDFGYLTKVKNEIKSHSTIDKILVWYERIFEKYKTFNDPYLINSGASWYLKEIQAFEAWDITQGGSNIVVAVLDSGFDLGHDEIKNKIHKPFDVSKLAVLQTYTNKIGQHGTHVASLSIGESNNNSGLSGVAPKCKLMPIKVGDDNGQIASSYIIDGVLYAIKNGAHVINISIGASLPGLGNLPQHIQEQIASNTAIDEGEFWNELFLIAEAKNVTIVLAAGNDNVLAKIDPMKRSQNVIIVGASNERNEIAGFSNYGQLVTITAPGTKILSATNGNTYEVLEGTSMASPIVAGACALMKSVKPNIKSSEILEIFKVSGKACNSGNQPIGPILQLHNALKQIKN